MGRFTIAAAPAQYDAVFMETMASEYLEQTAWTRLRLAAVRDLVDPRPEDRILDLGCAAGAVTHYLSQFGCQVVGVDAEPRGIAKATELFPGLDFVLADVAALPFADGSFDKAVAADVTEHLDDHTFDAMVRELRRVLRPGGTFSIYTPNPRHVIERLKERDWILAHNPTHIGLRDARTIAERLHSAGFNVDLNEWRSSTFAGLRTIERLVSPWVESLRYRLCVRAFNQPA